MPKFESNKKYYAVIAVLIATALWGFAPPVIKVTLDYIPLFTFLFLRFLIVSVLMLPIMIYEIKRNPVNLQDYPALIAIGVTSQVSLFLIFAGLKYTSAIEMSVLGIISPLLIVAAGHYFFNDKIYKRLKAGLVLASFGTLVIVIGPIFEPKDHIPIGLRLWGNFLVVLYQFAWTAFVMLSKETGGKRSFKLDKYTKLFGIKPLSKHYSSTFVSGFSFYVAMVAFLPLALSEGSLDASSLTLKPVLGLLYMAVFSSIVAYVLFEWALRYIKVTDTVIFSYLHPIFTFPAALLLISEKPTIEVIIGSAIIGIGIFVAESKKI